jgi:hypothetical protein
MKNLKPNTQLTAVILAIVEPQRRNRTPQRCCRHTNRDVKIHGGNMATNHAQLIGIWKLLACDVVDQASGARAPFYGATPPSGYLILTPEGRMMT